MLDKIKEYDANENFSNYIIDPELENFIRKNSKEENVEGSNSNLISKHPSEDKMKQGMRDLYSNRNKYI